MLVKKTGLTIFKITIMFSLAILFLGYTGTIAKAETTNNETVTLTGYLIDEHCFEHKSDNPGADTKECLLMDNCIKGGYGIAIPQNDGSYKFFYFNGKFFTDVSALDGTDAQKFAYDIIVAATKKDHLAITVTGAFGGETKPSISLQGVNYPVIDVINLAEATKEEVANLPQMANTPNAQHEKMVMGQEYKKGHFISIKYIGIILVFLAIFGVAAISISKRIKKAK